MSLKLIVVADSQQVKFFKANGLKIENHIKHTNASEVLKNHHDNELKQGFNTGGGLNQSHFYDPHTEKSEIERNDFSKFIMHELTALHQQIDFKELIIVAESKMLGALRHNLTKELKKLVTKEISKELIHADLQALEHQIFAE